MNGRHGSWAYSYPRIGAQSPMVISQHMASWNVQRSWSFIATTTRTPASSSSGVDGVSLVAGPRGPRELSTWTRRFSDSHGSSKHS